MQASRGWGYVITCVAWEAVAIPSLEKLFLGCKCQKRLGGTWPETSYGCVDEEKEGGVGGGWGEEEAMASDTDESSAE